MLGWPAGITTSYGNKNPKVCTSLYKPHILPPLFFFNWDGPDCFQARLIMSKMGEAAEIEPADVLQASAQAPVPADEQRVGGCLR